MDLHCWVSLIKVGTESIPVESSSKKLATFRARITVIHRLVNITGLVFTGPDPRRGQPPQIIPDNPRSKFNRRDSAYARARNSAELSRPVNRIVN